MRVSVMQMNPGANKTENIAQARRLIEQAVEQDRPNIVSLPEVWDSLGGDRATRAPPTRKCCRPKAPTNRAARLTSSFAKPPAPRKSTSMAAQSSSKGRRNCSTPPWCSILTARNWRVTARCTCSISSPPDGTGYRESNSYGAGDEVVTYEADGVKVGCAICYDIRFPDLFWKLRENGAEVIFLPSAFTLATGKDHWEALIRGRAIETQCWLAAPATWGKHLEGKGDPRFTYGHSMVVNPWGHLVAQVSDGIGWATARIDQDLTAKVRRDMPVLEHRKRV